MQADWHAWNQCSLAGEPIVRLILDDTVVRVLRVRLDKEATSISLLVVIGVRKDGQKVLLSVRNMGGETTSGAPCSTIWSRASCAGRPLSSWMARSAWSRRSRRRGRAFPAALHGTSTATGSPMPEAPL